MSCNTSYYANSFGFSVDYSKRLQLENGRLYRAQAAARDVFKSQVFPCYSSQYVNSQVGIKGAALGVYSHAYHAAAFVNHGFNLMIAVVQYVATSTLSVGDYVFGWAVNPVINTVYPINPINGHRHFLGLSRSVEKVLGDWVFYPLATLEMRQTNELLHGSNETIASKVNDVVQRILNTNGELLNPSNETTKFNYRVKTVASSTLNAFASPAGGMVVFTQLVREIEGAIKSKAIKETTVEFADGSTATVNLEDVTLEDALAALLGHEMTHVASRHSIASMGRSVLRSILSNIGNVLIEMKLSNSNQEYERSTWIEEVVEDFFRLFDSRQHEYEADVTGTYFTSQAGLNPCGALYLQEILNQDSGWLSDLMHKYLEFTYTHPYGENRKRALFAAINEMAPEALQGRTTWNIVDNGYDLKASSPAVAYANSAKTSMGK